jgi:drug/metabolite transporter (DMT)-like permease
VFGVSWGAIFLDERLPASAFTGALLVLAGVALTTRGTGLPAPSSRAALDGGAA